MMKIALLHGAYLNSGDFLILNRTRKLLKHCYPDCIINEYYRNTELDEQLEEINNNDILIFAGGPAYGNGFYPATAPLVKNLDDIKVPMMMIGLGWWGSDSYVDTIYSYQFSDEMKKLLNRVTNDSKILGCRDYFSCDVLRNNGYVDVAMTGCPAWYDIENVDITKYTGKKIADVDKICISDCANINNYENVITLITFIKKFFGEKDIYYVCHRGYPMPQLGIDKFFEKIGVKMIDISNSADGFKIYDDCDLHIGFRVHAHIYNLSKRKLSILIEEDSRGGGVDQALGLPRICANNPIISENKLRYISNNKICYQIEDYLLNLDSNNYIVMENAYMLMNRYYGEMMKHILSINEII